MTDVAPIKEDGFDYAALDPAIATPLRQQAERIRRRLGKHTEDIIETGRDLLAVKEKLTHGTFVAWIESELKLPARTAQSFMSAARLADKNATVALFSPATVYRLAAKGTPDDIRDAIIARAEAGDVASDREVRDIIDEAAWRRRAEKEKAASQARRARRRQESAAAKARREQAEQEAKERERRNEEQANAAAELIAIALDPGAAGEVYGYLISSYDYEYTHRAMLLIDALAAALAPTAPADDGIPPASGEPA